MSSLIPQEATADYGRPDVPSSKPQAAAERSAGSSKLIHLIVFVHVTKVVVSMVWLRFQYPYHDFQCLYSSSGPPVVTCIVHIILQGQHDPAVAPSYYNFANTQAATHCSPTFVDELSDHFEDHEYAETEAIRVQNPVASARCVIMICTFIRAAAMDCGPTCQSQNVLNNAKCCRMASPRGHPV
jgi:hypothetical protein